MVKHLQLIKSDHRLLLLILHGAPLLDKDERPFRFQAAWLTHPHFNNFLRENWINNKGLGYATENFGNKVKVWNKNVFGNIFQKKRKILERIDKIDRILSFHKSYRLEQDKVTLAKEYENILMQEEIPWL